MKLLRLLLFLAAGVVGLMVVLALLLGLPTVQTALVKRALNQHADSRVEIGRIAVGLNRIEVENLRVEWRGAILTAPSATIEVPVLSALRRRVSIKRVIAKGWTFDLTAAFHGQSEGANTARAPATEPTAAALVPPAASAGFFQLLRLPVELSIEVAGLEGSIISSKARGGAQDRTEITVFGGHFGVGREGEFAIVAKTTLSDQASGAAEVETKATVVTRMSTAFSFDHLRIVGTTTAQGARFPQHEKLDFNCDVALDALGEKYLFALRSLAGAEPKRLIDLNGRYLTNSNQVKGTWKCDLRDTDLASFTFGRRLPVFVAQGEGHFEADRSWNEIHASGKLETTVEKLENLRPALSVMGKMHALSDFDLVQQGTHIRVEQLRIELSAEKPVALLKAMQKFEFDLQTAELKVAEPAAHLLELTLKGVPLAWLSPATGDIVLTGDDAQGVFVVSAREGGFALRPTGRVVVGRISVSKAGRSLTQALDLSLSVAADLSPQGWQTNVSEFELRSNDAQILSGALKLGQVAGSNQPVKAAGEFRVDLALLATQPVGVGLVVLNRGRGEGTFSASLMGGTTSVAAKVQFDNLAAAAISLPKVTAEVRADLHPEGQVEAHIPFVFEKDGRASDLQLNAKLRINGPTCLIDGELIGSSFFFDDMKLFAALAEGPAKLRRSEPESAQTPFWSAISGPVKVAVKEVVYSNEVES